MAGSPPSHRSQDSPARTPPETRFPSAIGGKQVFRRAAQLLERAFPARTGQRQSTCHASRPLLAVLVALSSSRALSLSALEEGGNRQVTDEPGVRQVPICSLVRTGRLTSGCSPPSSASRMQLVPPAEATFATMLAPHACSSKPVDLVPWRFRLPVEGGDLLPREPDQGITVL